MSVLSTLGSEEFLPLSTSAASLNNVCPDPTCEEEENCEEVKVGGAENVAANFL